MGWESSAGVFRRELNMSLVAGQRCLLLLGLLGEEFLSGSMIRYLSR